MRQLVRDHEYLYTVKIVRGNHKVKTGDVVQIRARGMKGVATLLHLDLNDILYLTKEIIK